MPLSTYVGDTGRVFKLTLQYADPTSASGFSRFNISGYTAANFVIHFYNNPTTVVGAGTWTVLDGPNGVVQYTPAAADIATAGTYTIYLQLIQPAGPETMTPDTLTVIAGH